MAETAGYFGNYGTIKVDYTTVAEEAKKMIAEAYKTGGYDVVVADKKLDEPTGGIDVLVEAARHYAVPALCSSERFSVPIVSAMAYVVHALRTDGVLESLKEEKASANGELANTTAEKIQKVYGLLARRG